MKKFKFTILLAGLFVSLSSKALVGVGGYVPFPTTTQKDPDGSTSTFSFQPVLTLNYSLLTPVWGQYFLPEFGYVFHSGLDDEYSKKTMFLLLDFGHAFNDRLRLRYGYGMFMTKISGDGQEVVLNNGSSTSTFYAPSESRTSYNSTINLGIESYFTPNWSAKLEGYVFEFLSGDKRDFSYSINVVYHLGK